MQPVNLSYPSKFYMCGYGLIEMMISMALAGLIFVASSSIIVSHEAQNTQAEQYYLAQHEAQNILIIMQRELSRAGRNSNADVSNAFIYNGDKVYMLNTTKDCILYRYDRSEDGILNSENFGFRVRDGGLQQRKGSDVSCDGGLGWETISDTASIEVSQLQFTTSQQLYAAPLRIKAYVTISLSIRHRQLADTQLDYLRNSNANALL